MNVVRLNIFSEAVLAAADAVGVTTNGIIKRDGCAVTGAGVALAARRRFPGIESYKVAAAETLTAALIEAVRAECVKFQFPDEDRPEPWAALQALDAVTIK